MAQVVQKSSNIGTVKMAQQLGAEEMWHLFDQLRLRHSAQPRLPRRNGGSPAPGKTWRPIEQATMSYGHGISVSLIQMARAYLVFARDGELVPLSLTRLDGAPSSGQARVLGRDRAPDARHAGDGRGPGGTAPRAQIPGYTVAGKTGTAHKLEDGRYARKYISSFVGFAPASDPRIVVAVMVDEPSAASHYGGDGRGAGVRTHHGEGTLRTLGVAPDMPLTPLQLAKRSAEEAAEPAVPGGRTCERRKPSACSSACMRSA
jgi:cell division protein FtsI (penicillin-binding protein 3)